MHLEAVDAPVRGAAVVQIAERDRRRIDDAQQRLALAPVT
jgi:hypothetical protein